jgi:hypothetical protein
MFIGVTVTSCHSGGSPAAGGGSTNTGAAKSSAGSGGSGASGTKADPCTLATAGQLNAAAGVAVTQSQKGLEVNENACEWKSSDGEHLVTIAVFTDAVTQSDFAAEETNGAVTKVHGWTYPAYIETDNNNLHTVKDNTEILVSIDDNTDNTSNARILAKEETLATEAFAKI